MCFLLCYLAWVFLVVFYITFSGVFHLDASFDVCSYLGWGKRGLIFLLSIAYSVVVSIRGLVPLSLGA